MGGILVVGAGAYLLSKMMPIDYIKNGGVIKSKNKTLEIKGEIEREKNNIYETLEDFLGQAGIHQNNNSDVEYIGSFPHWNYFAKYHDKIIEEKSCNNNDIIMFKKYANLLINWIIHGVCNIDDYNNYIDNGISAYITVREESKLIQIDSWYIKNYNYTCDFLHSILIFTTPSSNNSFSKYYEELLKIKVDMSVRFVSEKVMNECKIKLNNILNSLRPGFFGFGKSRKSRKRNKTFQRRVL